MEFMKYDVLHDIKEIINCDEHDDYISIFKIVQFLSSVHENINDTNSRFVYNMDVKLNNYFNDKRYLDKNFEVCSCFFDFDKNELGLYVRNYSNELEIFYFSKRHGNIAIVEARNAFHKDKIFSLLNDDISKLYDFYFNLSYIYSKFSNEISVLNSNFKIDINFNSLELYVPKNYSLFERLVSLKILFYNNEHYCNAPSNDIIMEIENNYNEILKHAHIRLEDCPLWMQERLVDKDKKLVLEKSNNYS